MLNDEVSLARPKRPRKRIRRSRWALPLSNSPAWHPSC